MGHGIMSLLAIIALACFCIFLSFLVKGIRQKNAKIIFISTIALLLTVLLGSRIDLKSAGNFFSKEFERLKPKSPDEVYTAIFRIPVDSCVKIINVVDQVVPKIDCCVWLEFSTCPHELEKIINKLPYGVSKYTIQDSMKYNPASSPKPLWWIPGKLGDSLYRINFSKNSLTELTLLFNKDSTHVFYCDRAE